MTATPSHFQVSATGVPQRPESHYVVLDVAHDALAREALATMVAKLTRRGHNQLAEEFRTALRESNATFLQYIASQQPTKKGKTSMKGVNP